MNAAYTIEDQEQLAYLAGDVRTANLLARIAELEGEVRLLEEKIEDTMTLDEWEKRNGPGYSYVQFFQDCFERLSGHYPSPSVTSDYDKSIIFDAIERGEEANTCATDTSRSYGPRG
jgi:hypothetical protein